MTKKPGRRKTHVAGAALAGVFYAACFGGGLAAQTVAYDFPLTAKAAAKVSGSDEAISQLGPMAALLPQYAGMPVNVITRQDILDNVKDPALRQRLSRLPATGNANSLMDATEATKNHKQKMIEAFTRTVSRNPDFPHQDAVLSAVVEDSGETLLQKYKYGFAVSALTGNASAMVMGHKDRDNAGEKAHCVIALPDLTQDAKSIFSQMTGIPADKLRNIPGDGAAWNHAFLAHEAWHCRSVTLRKMETQDLVKFETDADRSALVRVFETSKSPAEAEALIKAFIGMRALSMVFSILDVDHSTSAFLSVPKPGDSPYPPAGDLYDGGAGATEFVQKTLDHIVKTFHFRNSIQAEDIVKDRPAVFYNAVKRLDEKRAYDGNPVAQRFAAQFLDAAETYAPDYFHIRQPGQAPRPVYR